MRETLAARITAVRERLLANVKRAAEEKQLRRLHVANRQLEELTAVETTINRSLRKLEDLEVEARIGIPTDRPSLRNFSVWVTQGMIDNQRLTLTRVLRTRLILVGEKMLITIPATDEVVRTEVMAQGKKLRCRGAIGRFFLKANVTAGTEVSMTETAPGEWVLNH